MNLVITFMRFCRHHQTTFQRAGFLPAGSVVLKSLRLIAMALFAHFFLGQAEVKAQHCGRIGYLPEWNQSQMVWETQDQAGSERFDSNTNRIRGSQCEGPLCRRQQPEPFSSTGTTALYWGVLPWRCNGHMLDLPDVESVLTDLAETRDVIANPLLDTLFKPPRFV